jgi:hypothetical protein
MVGGQGHTATTLCGAQAAFYCQVPVGHVGVGLRTGDPWGPFPEEMNRALTTPMMQLHFAATEGGARNLESEGIGRAHIHVTGNSGIDDVKARPGTWNFARRGVAATGSLEKADRRDRASPGEFGDVFEHLCGFGRTGPARRRADHLSCAPQPERARLVQPEAGECLSRATARLRSISRSDGPRLTSDFRLRRRAGASPVVIETDPVLRDKTERPEVLRLRRPNWLESIQRKS